MSFSLQIRGYQTNLTSLQEFGGHVFYGPLPREPKSNLESVLWTITSFAQCFLIFVKSLREFLLGPSTLFSCCRYKSGDSYVFP